jgi:hypothetical protein
MYKGWTPFSGLSRAISGVLYAASPGSSLRYGAPHRLLPAPISALKQARALAGDLDVRIGAGSTQFGSSSRRRAVPRGRPFFS